MAEPDTAAGILAGLIVTVQVMQMNAQASGDAARSAHLTVTVARLQRAAQSLARGTGADALKLDAFHSPVDKLVDDIRENRT